MAKRVIGQNQQAFKNVGKALRAEGSNIYLKHYKMIKNNIY